MSGPAGENASCSGGGLLKLAVGADVVCDDDDCKEDVQGPTTVQDCLGAWVPSPCFIIVVLNVTVTKVSNYLRCR